MDIYWEALIAPLLKVFIFGLIWIYFIFMLAYVIDTLVRVCKGEWNGKEKAASSDEKEV